MEIGANKPRDRTLEKLRKLLWTKGQGLVEYAMILLMVAIVMIALLTVIGQQVFHNFYSRINSGFPGSP